MKFSDEEDISVTLQRWRKEDGRLRIGIAGCGSIGQRHAKNLVSEGVKDLVLADMITTRDLSARFEGKLGPKVKSLAYVMGAEHAIQTEEVDAWMICTPWDQHHDLARLALKHCNAVFVEKPLVASVEDALHLVHDGAGKVTQVGYNWLFHPDVEAYKVYQSTAPVTDIAIYECCADMETWPGKYGPIWLECSHEISMALYCHGPVAEVIDHVVSETGGRLDLLHESGQRSMISLRIEVGQEPRRGMWRSPGAQYQSWDTSQAVIDQTYVDEVRHFLAHVVAKQDTAVPFTHGLEVLKMLEAKEFA